MHNPRARVGKPGFDGGATKPPGAIAGAPRPLPTWNRELLIRQFQGIDASSRSEAERQIDAFERSFSTVFGGPPATGTAPGGDRR
jgi:hypothetical protein